MEAVNYYLVILGGAICALVVVGLIAGRPAVRAKSLPVRLAVLFGAGILSFGGSQIMGRGFIGWWPFLGPEKFFIRLVKVAVSPHSGRIAVVAFGGCRGEAIASSSQLFVAGKDGKRIVKVCEGDVRDVYWSKDAEELYVLCGLIGRGEEVPKSLWRYSPSTGKLSYVRGLPRQTILLSLDPADRYLLFAASQAGEGDGKVTLVRGQINNEKEDQGVCWRRGWQGGYTWGPKSGRIFVATDETSSFGKEHGLWMLRGDTERSLQPAVLLEMHGIEGISLSPAETYAALVVRRWPPPSFDFDLYALNLADGSVKPLAPGVEYDSTVWDTQGKRLLFADRDGVKSYSVSTGHVRLLVEALPSRINPNLRENLRPLSYGSSGDIVFQTGSRKVEVRNARTGRARVLFDVARLRRYFKWPRKQTA